MENQNYKIKVGFENVLELISQLPDNEKEKLAFEIEDINKRTKINLTDEKIKNILRTVRPFLSQNLGKYTHQKSSDDWSFVGFAFTKKDLGYIFGINVGFFKRNEENLFNYTGMNILVRTNGGDDEYRLKILNFFRTNLNQWSNQNEKIYSYPARGDEGIEVARYKKVDEFSSQNEIIEYIKGSILLFHELYPKIIENSDLFEDIVRAAPKWDERFIDICQTKL